MPDRSNRYQLPSWPPTDFTRDLWNSIFGDIADRLTAREDLEASFEALQAQGIQASLDYIQANLAPQIANLQTSIQLAQDQIDQIIIDGVSPNSLKLGGQLPSYYASAQALIDGLAGKVSTSLTINNKPLDGNIALKKEDVGLGNVDNTKDADKPISTEQANALAKRVRVDNAQQFTELEKGRARGNIGADILAGYRNKLLNGNFDIWQRASSQTISGYGSDDRWANNYIGGSHTVSVWQHPLGQTDVPGNPTFFSRTIVTHAAGAGNYHMKRQTIEDVRLLSGKTVTITFYARANAALPMFVEMTQTFGVGGSPSTAVNIPAGKVMLSTAWQRFDFLVTLPSIAGKTIGSNGGSGTALTFWFEAGSDMNSRFDNLGQRSGTFDISRVSVVLGDARSEADPFEPRHVSQELMMCQRYYERGTKRFWGPNQAVFLGNSIEFAVTKRAAPTVTLINATLGGGINLRVEVPTIYKFDLLFDASGTSQTYFETNWLAECEI
ncbi:hypothetical protein [Rhizobium sp. LC145]|uniref:hypothetical protein n=1 Tax=Rhizobium sp. LC145 TaxID=1120688 RepID=UPI00069BBC1C|nr:hypothetical protein [Rhizobium sp. LC145]TKT46180.1 hypothetical protein FDR95_23775 [Rhizobiaceae bacterium LC148]